MSPSTLRAAPWSRRLAGVLVVVAATATPRGARGEESRAAADALFAAGKELYGAARYDEACPKLAASQRAAPAAGTLLLLGLCHAKQGKTASAEAELRSALALARRDRRPDRERLAAAALEGVAGRAPRVTLALESPPAGLRLTLDGGPPLGAESLGVPLPVDPGSHLLVVEADGHTPARVAFEAPDAPELVPLPLPALARRAPPPAREPSTAPPTHDRPSPSPLRTAATWTTAGVAVVGLGLGGAFGVHAIVRNADAEALCDPARCANAEGLAANEAARSSATVANVGLAVGAAALVGLAVLWLTAPSAGPTRGAGTRPLLLAF